MSQNICRICESKNNLKNLFYEENTGIVYKIISCANVTIEPNDHLPKFICDQCEINLNIAYEFKEQCESNDRKWRVFVEFKETDDDNNDEKENQIDDNYTNNDDNYTNNDDNIDSNIQYNSTIIESIYPLFNERNFSKKLHGKDKNYDNIIETYILNKNNLQNENELQQYNENVSDNDGTDNEKKLYIPYKDLKDYNEELNNDTKEINQIYINDTINNRDDSNEIISDDFIVEEEYIENDYHDDGNENENEHHILEDYLKLEEDEISIIEEVIDEESLSQNSNFDMMEESSSTSVNKCMNENNYSHNDATTTVLSPSSSTASNTKMKFTIVGKIFECDTCNEKFSSYNELNQHKKAHGNQRYQCMECLKWFSKRFRLKNHLEIHNENKIMYECDKCNNKYSNQGNLDRHIRHFHKNVRPYVCTECGLSFSRSHTFNIHQSVHTQERNYECDICEKRFKALYYLQIHKKIHLPKELRKKSSQNKSYKTKTKKSEIINCQYCGKTSNSKSVHLSHIRMHTGEKPFICKYCGKAFAFRPSLRVHEFVHTGEKPYKCKLCNLSFRQFGHLKGHSLVHTGIKNYSCEHCGKSFALKSNLVVHLRMHTGEKPYKCNICNKKYYDSNSFKRHKQKHNNNADDCLQQNEIIIDERNMNVKTNLITSVKRIQTQKNEEQQQQQQLQQIQDNLVKLIKENNAKL